MPSTKDVSYYLFIYLSLFLALYCAPFVYSTELSILWVSAHWFLGFSCVMCAFNSYLLNREEYFIRNVILKAVLVAMFTYGLHKVGFPRFVSIFSILFVCFSTWRMFSYSIINTILMIFTFLLCFLCNFLQLATEHFIDFIVGTLFIALGLFIISSQNDGVALWKQRSSFAAVAMLGCCGFIHSFFFMNVNIVPSLGFPILLTFSGCCTGFAYRIGVNMRYSTSTHFVMMGVVSFTVVFILFELVLKSNLRCFFFLPICVILCIIFRRSIDFINTENDIAVYGGGDRIFTPFPKLLKSNRESRLFIFLLLTLAIMILEFLYGIAVNSLGLISDSFHMLLDAVSIGVGLYAVHASSWKRNEKTHPFGYGRYEILGGFVNGVLLLFIALFVVRESIERIIDPPEIEASYLMLVAVIGLLINVVGIIFFHDSHGHSHCHDGCSDHTDHNMKGVYLHILADLLGSVSVIISSFLMRFFGLWVADPLCSALSALLIFFSALPLLEETGKVLLLSVPSTPENLAAMLQKKIIDTSLLTQVDLPKLWMHSTTPREFLFCMIIGRLRNCETYATTRASLEGLAREMIHEHLGVQNVNVLLHLE